MGRPAQRLTRLLLDRNLLINCLVRFTLCLNGIGQNKRGSVNTWTYVPRWSLRSHIKKSFVSLQDARTGVYAQYPYFSQLASLHITACQCRRGGSVHAYHGSRDDEAAEQRQIRRAMREAAKGGKQPGAPPQHVPEGAARSVMRDPLAMLLTATGVPLGINMRMDPSRTPLTDAAVQDRLQAVTGAEQEITAAEGAAEGKQSQRAAEVTARLSELVDSLPAMLAQHSTQDTWGTTQESAAEIARRIADSIGGEREVRPAAVGLFVL